MTLISSRSHKSEDMLIKDLSIGSSSWTMRGEMVCPSSSPHSSSESCLLERVHAQRKDSMRRGVVLRSCVRNGGAEEGGQCAQQGDWQSQEGGSSWVSSLALACNLKSLTIKNLSVCKCTGNLLRISYMRVAPEIVVGPGFSGKEGCHHASGEEQEHEGRDCACGGESKGG